MNPSIKQTTCCVVGGGPAGAVLALLLARKGVPVTLLEAHHDFERDFRGDTLHPSILEIMDQIGLADRLLQLPHTKLSKAVAQTPDGPVEVADFSHLKTRFPYIAFMPQAQFLDFIVDEAKQYPAFELRLGARVDALIEEGDEVRGVRYPGPGGEHEIHALLTVGADGRFSRVRKLGRFEAEKASAPMDVMWFRLPRLPGEAHGLMGRFGRGHLLIQLERQAQWQLGFVIAKDSYSQLRAAGMEALHRDIVEVAPELAGRVNDLKDWKQISLLSVEADFVKRWYRPGLLLIGDAAHVMSPAGGNGINYAIQDAVVTANLLTQPLKAGRVTLDDLAGVQRQRERPVRLIQAAMNLIQENFLRPGLASNRQFTVPGVVRWPFVGDIVARVLAFGLGRVRVADP